MSGTSLLRRKRISEARRRGATAVCAGAGGHRRRLASRSPASPASSSASRLHLDASSTEFQRVLVVHDDNFMSLVKRDLIVNPEYFQGLKRNDVIEIFDPQHPSRRVVLQVTSLDHVKGNLQISLQKRIADLFELKNRSEVIVRVLDPELIAVDFIELTFTDQYVSRGDMWRFKKALINSCVYQTQTVTALGIVARINEMLVNGAIVSCGLISLQSKFIFRSSSARVIWMVQLSDEMWDYSDDGDLHFERMVNGLLKVLFQKWQDLKVNHALSIVLFARTFYEKDEEANNWDAEMNSRNASADASNVFQTDHQDRLYQDFYKLAVDSEVREDWASLRTLLKKEINEFSQNLRWGVTDEVTGLKGVPSLAVEGNMLEAINLSLNVFDKHYIDRDLKRTGQEIVVLTAGTGVWVVDRSLIELSKERMVDNGIGCDVISVSRPPLHSVPLFIYKPTPNSPHGQNQESFYCIADDWIDMKYYITNNGEPAKICACHGSVLQRGVDKDFVPIPWYRMFPDVKTIPEPNHRKLPANDLSSRSCDFIQKHNIECCFSDKMSNGLQACVIPHYPKHSQIESTSHDSDFIDYEAYDMKVFADTSANGGAQRVEPGRIKHIGSFPSLERLLKSSCSLSPLRRTDSFHRRMSTSVSQSPPQDRESCGSAGRSNAQNSDCANLASESAQGFPFIRNMSRRASLSCISDSQGVDEVDDSGGESLVGNPTRSEPLSSSAPKVSRFIRSFERDQPSGHCRRWYSNQLMIPPDSMSLRKVKLTRPLTTNENLDPLSSAIFAKRSQRLFRVKPKSQNLVSVLVESTLMDAGIKGAQVTSTLANNEKDFVFNPFRMHIPVPKMASNRKRWVHLFPVNAAQAQPGAHSRVDLRSLCIPAVLPLTTDYFPGADELQKSFMTNITTLSLIPNENQYHNRVDYLLSELITQRLTQDFQLNVRTKHPSASSGTQKSARLIYQLTLGTENHQIELDSESGNIEVQRYIRRSLPSDRLDSLFPYRYFLWSDHADELVPVDMTIASHHVEFNWNYLDQLTAGYHDNFIGGLKYRRLRFSLVPPDSHSDENASSRVSQFTKFMETLSGQSLDRLGIVTDSEGCESSIWSRSGSFERDASMPRPKSSSMTALGLAGVGVRAIRIALQSLHRDRHEWLRLQYDTVFNPAACFHIEVQWLVATGLQIDNWLTKCRQFAKDFGIRLIQIPTDQPLRTSDPFHVPLLIPIATQVESELAQSYLLSSFDFVLDSNYSSWRRQYMHRSGMAIVRVLQDGLLWVNNNLMSQSLSKQQSIDDYRKFRMFCSVLSDMRQLAIYISHSVVDLQSDYED